MSPRHPARFTALATARGLLLFLVSAAACPAGPAPEKPQSLASPRSLASRLPPELHPHLVCAYDFEHPAPDDPALELDQGSSGPPLLLVNGGPALRVPDGAHADSRHSLQTRQINPALAGQDDWKAGVFDPAGAPALARFAATRGLTLAGWVKSTAPTLRPAPDTTTPAPDDRFPSICLFGILHGRSDGHYARALIELIPVEGRLRLIALGRRLDEGQGLVLAATSAPDELLPPDTWVHLAATFDYATGAIMLFRNGDAVPAERTTPGDPWRLADGDPDSIRSSDTPPVGLKIGGSYPQNTRERNPFDGRFDDLLFFDRVLSPAEVRAVSTSAAGHAKIELSE